MPSPGGRAGADELVEAAFVRDAVEAEMIKALLGDAGIPSMVRPVGVNGPQLGFALLPRGGSQQVMVHASRLKEARAVIAGAPGAEEEEP